MHKILFKEFKTVNMKNMLQKNEKNVKKRLTE